MRKEEIINEYMKMVEYVNVADNTSQEQNFTTQEQVCVE
jgi:hypothetical protein